MVYFIGYFQVWYPEKHVCWCTFEPCNLCSCSGSSLSPLGSCTVLIPLEKDQTLRVFNFNSLCIFILKLDCTLTFSRWGRAGVCSSTVVLLALHAAGAAPAAPAPSAGPHTSRGTARVWARLTHSTTTTTFHRTLPSRASRTNACWWNWNEQLVTLKWMQTQVRN